jgi:hypothetical protein
VRSMSSRACVSTWTVTESGIRFFSIKAARSRNTSATRKGIRTRFP